jgi:hypothetical protein
MSESEGTGTKALSPSDEWVRKQVWADLEVAEDGMKIVSLRPESTQNVNVLGAVSQVIQVSRNFTPMVKLAYLSIEKDSYRIAGRPGTPGEERALTLQALRKLAEMRGIEHVQTDIDYMGGIGIRATVTGRMRGADGIWRASTKTRAMRYEARARKLRNEMMSRFERFNAKWWELSEQGAHPERVPAEHRSDIKPPPSEAEMQQRVDDDLEFAEAVLESKSWARVIRDLLAVKNAYTRAELARPFLVISYVFTPQANDPLVGKLLELQYIEGRTLMYGAPAPELERKTRYELQDPGGERTDAFVDSEWPSEEPPFGDPGMDTEEMEVPVLDEDWGEEPQEEEQGVQVAKPEEFVLSGGRYKGQPLSEVVQDEAAISWLIEKLPRLSPRTQQAILDHLSYRFGRPVTLENVDKLGPLPAR